MRNVHGKVVLQSPLVWVSSFTINGCEVQPEFSPVWSVLSRDDAGGDRLEVKGFKDAEEVSHHPSLAAMLAYVTITHESREMLGIMPQQASPLPEGPCPDTNAER
jgi:hypothetical protein